MKRHLLVMAALLCGIMAANAQVMKNAGKLRKATPASSVKVSQVTKEKVANAFQFRKGDRPFYAPRKAEGDTTVTLLYSYPSNALFYDLTDDAYNYASGRAITGAYEDVTFDNYSRIETESGRERLKNVQWRFQYGGEDGEEPEIVEPRDSSVAEDGSLTAQGYGFYPFPTVLYGDESYIYQYIDDEDVTDFYWVCGSDSIVVAKFSTESGETEVKDCTISNAAIQMGFYSGYSGGGEFTTGENFLTLDDYLETGGWTNTGKKLVGFAEYYEKPSGLIYASEIVAWFWTEDLDAIRPFSGNTLKATIYTFDENNNRIPYAEATATQKNLTKVGENGLASITFKFEEYDELLGTIESPITLPEEDFLVVLEGFDKIKKGSFTAPFSPADGFVGHGYALLDDGSFATIGYTNVPDEPQCSLHIGFRAAIPVVHYADYNLEEVIFYEDGGLGIGQYDEEEEQAYGYVIVSTLSNSDMWDEIDIPDWVTYEMDDTYVEDGIMTISFEAEPLPEGVNEREGEAVFELFGKQLSIKLYQFNYDWYVQGIDNVKYNFKKQSTKTYNMAGQLVNSNYKGLVIKNGKKYFVK